MRRANWGETFGPKRVGKDGRFQEVPEQFYEVVDEQCNLTLDRIAGESRVRGYEVMVRLFCVGKTHSQRRKP